MSSVKESWPESSWQVDLCSAQVEETGEMDRVDCSLLVVGLSCLILCGAHGL